MFQTRDSRNLDAERERELELGSRAENKLTGQPPRPPAGMSGEGPKTQAPGLSVGSQLSSFQRIMLHSTPPFGRGHLTMWNLYSISLVKSCRHL